MSASKLNPNNLPDSESEREDLAKRLKTDALAAQQRGELLTAMLYASDALMLFPNAREYLDLVDEIALGAHDPLSVVPVASGAVHVATAAARARILMMQQNLGDALDLLGAVVDAAPDLAYLDWARRWLQPHVIQSLGFERLFSAVGRPSLRLALAVPVPPRPTDPRLSNLAAGAEIFALLRQQFPNEAPLFYGEALIRRRLGDPGRTMAVASEGVQRFPSEWRMQTAMAMACRDAQRPDESLHYARAAMQLDPEDNSPLHDAAWAFYEAGRAPDAAGLFQELLQRQPDYPGGKAAFHYSRFKAFGSEEDKQALVRLREREWWDEHTRDLANEIDRVQPYYNYLPGPGEATAAGARHVTRELAAVFRCCGRGASIGYDLISAFVESPSVALAFDVAIRNLGGAGATLNVEVENVQQPDPRADKAPATFRVWNYDGFKAKKQYPEAHPQAQQGIAYVADQTFRQEIWQSAAQQVAAQSGPDWVHAFMAVLTDPPAPPDHGQFDGFIWTYRCQVATAVVLSHLGPWESGPGRAAIYSLLYGPSDWVTSAGLIALAWLARANPALRPEAEGVFQWLRGRLPPQGFSCWEAPLVNLWLGLEHHGEPQRLALEQWRDEYEQTVHLKNRARKPVRRFGGLTLKQYAEFCIERDQILGKLGIQGAGAIQALAQNGPTPELAELCQRFSLPLRHPVSGHFYPYIEEWQEALNANGELQEAYAEYQRDLQLVKMGVSGEEIAALDEIRAGNMDMHLRMAQQQQAQREVAQGNAGDPDPVVFPGQPVAKLSDYVGIMKRMQTGDMMGALGAYGLDMMSYGAVATAWGAKLAADPTLNEKFSRMMSG